MIPTIVPPPFLSFLVDNLGSSLGACATGPFAQKEHSAGGPAQGQEPAGACRGPGDRKTKIKELLPLHGENFYSGNDT